MRVVCQQIQCLVVVSYRFSVVAHEAENRIYTESRPLPALFSMKLTHLSMQALCMDTPTQSSSAWNVRPNVDDQGMCTNTTDAQNASPPERPHAGGAKAACATHGGLHVLHLHHLRRHDALQDQLRDAVAPLHCRTAGQGIRCLSRLLVGVFRPQYVQSYMWNVRAQQTSSQLVITCSKQAFLGRHQQLLLANSSTQWECAVISPHPGNRPRCG